MPLTNVYAKGTYTVTMNIGSEKTPVNLIVDTGSSTLVVGQRKYHPENDLQLTPTSIAQEITYAIGGWDGPVVHTDVTLDNGSFHITLEQCPMAVVSQLEQTATFGEANGILGLAYHKLNDSYDLSDYLTKQGISPAHTYPWPFKSKDAPNSSLISSSNTAEFKAFLRAQPEQDILPYFTELETQNLCANRFAFFSQRSSIHISHHGATVAQLKNDPLNQGYLIFGGGKEQTHLYKGEFQTLKVEHNVHYNVTLDAIQIGNQPPIKASPLKPQFKNYLSNAIIDTGVSGIMLTNDLFSGMLNALDAIDKQTHHSTPYRQLIAPFADLAMQNTGIDAKLIHLNDWPDIKFIFKRHKNPEDEHSCEHCEDDPIVLTCKPHDYWQLNSPDYGKACFKIIGNLANWANQTLIGLPLLNNYYVIFDREVHQTGVIRFAEQIPQAKTKTPC